MVLLQLLTESGPLGLVRATREAVEQVRVRVPVASAMAMVVVVVEVVVEVVVVVS